MSVSKTTLEFTVTEFMEFYSQNSRLNGPNSDAKDLLERSKNNINWLFPSKLEFDLDWYFIKSKCQYTYLGQKWLEYPIHELINTIQEYKQLYNKAILETASNKFYTETPMKLYITLNKIEAVYKALRTLGNMNSYIHSNELTDSVYRTNILKGVEELLHLSNMMYSRTNRTEFMNSVTKKESSFGLKQLTADLAPD